MVENGNFGTENPALVENLNQKSIFVTNGNFGTNGNWVKNRNLVKNRNFCQKWKFWSKIETYVKMIIFVKIRNISKPIQFFIKKPLTALGVPSWDLTNSIFNMKFLIRFFNMKFNVLNKFCVKNKTIVLKNPQKKIVLKNPKKIVLKIIVFRFIIF